MQALLVIIPCYNEATNLEALYQELQAVSIRGREIKPLFINDGSQDHSQAILEEKGLPHLHLCNNLGIGGASQAGYRYALENGFKEVVRIDGDGQHPPQAIARLLETMEREKAQVVIGSRFVEKQGFQSSLSRRLGIRWISNWVYRLSGVRVLDITSGFSLIRGEAIKLAAQHYPDSFPEPESVVLFARQGLKIAEAPVKMRPRQAGRSSINTQVSMLYMFKVLLGVFFIYLKFKRHGSDHTA